MAPRRDRSGSTTTAAGSTTAGVTAAAAAAAAAASDPQSLLDPSGDSGRRGRELLEHHLLNGFVSRGNRPSASQNRHAVISVKQMLVASVSSSVSVHVSISLGIVVGVVVDVTVEVIVVVIATPAMKMGAVAQVHIFKPSTVVVVVAAVTLTRIVAETVSAGFASLVYSITALRGVRSQAMRRKSAGRAVDRRIRHAGMVNIALGRVAIG